jgi:hypothetical protein
MNEGMNKITRHEAGGDRFNAALTDIIQRAEQLLYKACFAQSAAEFAQISADADVLQQAMDMCKRSFESALSVLA